jgi:hypothetical protein
LPSLFMYSTVFSSLQMLLQFCFCIRLKTIISLYLLLGYDTV